MCGIVGFTGCRNDALLEKMKQHLHHRGPDSEGSFFCPEGGVSLAMRRLAIIDIQHGHQPMLLPQEGLAIVFNGEIFNCTELKRELQNKGRHFNSHHSDTEVLLHLYAEYGEEMLEHINGMFAFVIYDKFKGRLFGAVDRMGIKPLYYSLLDGQFCFASEMKSLIQYPKVGQELDGQAIYHYFSFQCIPAPLTIFKNLRKIQAGHIFNFDVKEKSFNQKSYWTPFNRQVIVPKKAEELPNFIRHELKEATERWCNSDVPLASSLSGGIDSASITALVASSGRSLATYTLGFEGNTDIDERSLAFELSQKYNTEHHEIILTSKELLESLPSMVWSLDEPYGGGLPSWFIFKNMSGLYKVAMTGVGGDELFGNYRKWAPYLSWRHKIVSKINIFSTSPQGQLYHPLYFKNSEKLNILQPDFLSFESSEQYIQRLWEEGGQIDPKNAIPRLDLQHQLSYEFLPMIDRFSMAHSVEARTPMLDHIFVEKMLSIPSQYRSNTKTLKGLLIDAMRDLLPASFLNAPKRGFVIPFSHWLKTELRTEVINVLSPTFLEKQGIFKPTVFSTLVKPHLEGKNGLGAKLWTLFMFQKWYVTFASV